MTQVHLFSHNDLDGLSTYFPLKEAFGERLVTNKFCSYARINSMLTRFLKNQNLTDILFITDISIDQNVISLLQERHKKGQPIYFIDHHANNEWMNQYEWAYVFPVLGEKKTCATTLVTEFLKEKFEYKPGLRMYSYIELVRSYDVWDWKADGNEKAKQLNDFFFLGNFQEFVDTIYEILTDKPDEKFDFPKPIKDLLVLEQKKIQRYLEAKEKEMRKVTIQGRSVGLAYAENYQSELGNHLAETFPEVDFVLLINLSTRRASVRSLKPENDCNVFASKYGGGGHPQASGFPITADNINSFIFI